MSQSTEELIAENERLRQSLSGSRGTLDTWTSGLGSAARGLGGFAAAALSGEEKLSSYQLGVSIDNEKIKINKVLFFI